MKKLMDEIQVKDTSTEDYQRAKKHSFAQQVTKSLFLDKRLKESSILKYIESLGEDVEAVLKVVMEKVKILQNTSPLNSLYIFFFTNIK